jgi:hypothetical protein
MHEIKVMAEKIGFQIRKLPENTSLYPIMGQTKTRKLPIVNHEYNLPTRITSNK